MFIRIAKRPRRGFTLVEFIIATGCFGTLMVAVMTMYLFSTRSFAALVNYAELDKTNRQAMDTLTRELRKARKVLDVVTNSAGQIKTLYLINGDGLAVTYNFDPDADDNGGKLIRCIEVPGTGADDCSILLTHCKVLSFNIYQRTGIDGTFNQYYPAPNDSIQVVSLTWQASRKVGGSTLVNTENIQTARVVIRNQHQYQ
jgi:type II secretory pathway pseudopilin PulG